MDHKYLRDHPGSAFARHVVCARNPSSPLPFLDSAALAHRLDDLREFYSQPRSFVLDRSYPYLSEASMDREDCAQATLTLVSRLKAGASSQPLPARPGPAGHLRLALNSRAGFRDTPVPSNTGHVSAGVEHGPQGPLLPVPTKQMRPGRSRPHGRLESTHCSARRCVSCLLLSSAIRMSWQNRTTRPRTPCGAL